MPVNSGVLRRSLFASVLAFAAATSFNQLASAQRGVQINVDPNTGEDIVGDAANEPSFIASSLNPNRLVVGWREFPTISSDARYAGIAVSSDGGLTWTNKGILPKPPGIPTAQQTDPLLAVDSSGVFYYWTEVFRPVSNLHHFVYRSYDDGDTWTTPVLVQDPATPGDKDWLVCDRTGGIGDGNLYGGWNNFNLGGQCFVRSTDGGASYSSPVRIADSGGTQWMLHWAIGPDGELYGAWRNYSTNSIYVTKSTNAQDPNQTPTFNALGNGGRNGIDVRVDAGNDPGFMSISPVGFHQIYIDVDRSNGPRRGNVYICWADRRRDVCDIYFARSTDGGFTWDTGIRVNDDQIGSGNYQWMPAMSVAPNGRIDVCWYDSRNSVGQNPPWMELYYASSNDGGNTWSTNERLSDAFDVTVGWPSQSKIGDYIQSQSDDAGMNIIYSATFNGGQDLYFIRKSLYSLDVGRLIAGQLGQFDATGGNPGAATFLAYSIAGPGQTYIGPLNVTLGLQNPKQAGNKKFADGNGNVSWTLPVPPNTSGFDLWIQVAQFENVTNVVATTVE